MGKVIADEGKAIGVHAMMSPVADVSRDARWGRVDETFGEDPLVCARFTSEEVRGIQGEDYTSRCAALANIGLDMEHPKVELTVLRSI